MLISTGMPGIQCRLWHHVRANQSQSPCLSCTCQSFIAAAIVRSCHSAPVRAMFIGAGSVRDLVTDLVRELASDLVRERVRNLVRDHVRDHLEAALVRATLGRATFIRARIVRDYVRAHCHSQGYQGQCQSHINQTTIVRDHIRAAPATVKRWWLPASCCSTNLMRKISITSRRSHTADTLVKPSYLW